MDKQFIITIIDKFCNANMTELAFNDGTASLVLRKEMTEYIPKAPNQAALHIDAANGGAQEHTVRLGIAASPSAHAEGGGETITSPIVATFYAAPSPDAPPFVKPGSKVKAGQTLCILEAMKMMNHLEAEFDCEIVEAHVSSGELVEYGQKLFTVKKG